MIFYRRYIRIYFSFLIAGLFLQGFVFMAYSQNYEVHNYTTEEGLPQPYVYSLIQDDNGFIWIGTGNGLSKFDGITFRTYTVKDSLADNFITCSYKSDQGIWFGHMSGDISYYLNGKFRKIISSAEDKSMITDIEPGPGNSIWASSYANGFFRVNGESIIITAEADTNAYLSVTTFKFMDEKELLVGSVDGLSVWKYQKTKGLFRQTGFPYFSGKRIVKILEIEKGNIYLVATQDDGIYRLQKGKDGYEILNTGINGDIKGIQNILMDKDSNIWIATFGSGLYKIRPAMDGKVTEVCCFNEEQDFSAQYIKVLFEDREGIIWTGNYGSGLSRIINKPYSFTSYQEAIESNNILSVCSDDSCRWLGTERGLLKVDRVSGKIDKIYNSYHGLPADDITDIFKTGDYLWLGTKGSGVYRFDPVNERAEYYPIHDGALENSISSITGREDVLWIGTMKGLCKVNLSNDSIHWYTIQDGTLPDNSVQNLFYDTSGKLWISTSSNILSAYKDNVTEKITFPSENGNFTMNTVTEDESGRIWVGTLGAGVFLFDSDTIIHLSSKEGLSTDFCYSMIHDTRGNLWVGHYGSISRIDTRNFYIKSFKEDFKIPGTCEFNTNASSGDEKGIVRMGSNMGELSINMAEESNYSIPPLLSITSIKINDEEVGISPKIILRPGRYKLGIEYIGISMKEPERVKYQYILEGYDEIPVLTETTAIKYPRLTDGRYTFSISAVNDEGIGSGTPLCINIIIKSPFWKLPWFYSTVFVIILMVILWIVRIQRKHMLQRNIELEVKVKERTQEVVQQKEELERQNILINKKNKDITDSITYASSIQKAIIAPIEHVTDLLPDSFLLDRPRDIVSGDFYWVTKSNGKVIFAVADCSGHGVPGAFMSILGNTLLNDIVNEKKISSPEKILTQMRSDVIQSLRQQVNYSISRDSINMAICSFDKRTNTLQYAGAYQPLVYIHDNNLNLIKPNRLTLGISYDDEVSFKLHEFALKKGDQVYIFSDGVEDQFGGSQSKKFTKRRLCNTLLENCHLPMDSQLAELERTLDKWKGNNEQTDDMMLLGVKF